ncbi:MAG TPA: aminoacyl-tRNA hydrolase [Terriglobales bacterium]|jgi:PTH1 family peptidyl-tRNA hydrolase|nr:aminoacyl-tRNA hydrolase [Terriglobales bacterium]
MKLIVGLGNPGMEYQFTPHNMGFLAIDRIAEKHGVQVINRHCHALTARFKIGEVEALLAKPETFMNLSGRAVRELVAKYEADVAKDLIVIYDELDFPLGTLRIRERGSSAGHNGMESVIGALGTQEFVRIRLGIAPEHKVSDGARYVLSQLKKAQYKFVDEVLDRAAEAVEVILTEGVSRAMNRFNQREKGEES